MISIPALAERRWNVLDDGILAYALAALRTLWVWPLLQWMATFVVPEADAPLAAASVLALLAGGTAAAQVGIFVLKGPRTALGLGLIGLAAVFAALYLSVGGGFGPFDTRWLQALLADRPRSLLTVLLAAGLWWWGLRAGRDRVAYDELVRNFAGGLLALLLLAALNGAGFSGATSGAAEPFLSSASLLAYLAGFVALGLFMLALASIQDARRYESARADHQLPLARHWWSTVAVAVLALLLLALLVSRLVAPSSLDAAMAAVATVLGLIGQLASWLILVVSYPIFWLLALLAPLLNFERFEVPVPTEVNLGANLMLPDRAGLQDEVQLAPALQVGMGVVGTILLAGLILLAFMLAFRRFRTYAVDDVAEMHESILSLDLIKAQMAQLLRRRGSGKAARAPFVTLHGDDPYVRIRRIYQSLLSWASAQGLGRQTAMTPEHFCHLLSDAFPQHSTQFATITRAYNRARYGPPAGDEAAGSGAEGEEMAAAAAAAWSLIVTSPL